MSEQEKGQMDAMFSNTETWNLKNAQMEIERYERLLDILPKKDNKQILEVACAEGTFTSKLFDRFKPKGIIGVDISQNAINRAIKDYHEKYNHKILFQQLDIEDEEVVGRFDVIYLVEVLYLIRPEKVEGVIKKLVDNLVPGGYLIVQNNWIRNWHGDFGVQDNKIIEKYLVKEEDIKHEHKWADPENHNCDGKPYPVHHYSTMRFRKDINGGEK